MNKTNHIIQSGDADEMDEAEAYMELIRENIEYDALMSCPTWRDREYYEELYQLICEVVCVPRKTIRIAPTFLSPCRPFHLHTSTRTASAL